MLSLYLQPASAQGLDLENLDEEKLTGVLLEKINSHRKANNLPVFGLNETLTKAAKDQSDFNRKFGKADHEQPSPKKATVADRIRYYKGQFSVSDEFDAGMTVQTKVVLKSSSKHKDPSTIEEIADYFLAEWQKNKKMNEVLLSDAFFHCGIGSSANHIDNLLFITTVVAGEPYENESGFKYHKSAFKIAPYDKDACKSFERNHSYLDELFADNIRIRDGRIKFYYHDLNLVESFLQSSKDGLAVDILKNEQFSCDHGNVIHPSPIHEGMMLKPVWKNRLIKANRLKEKKEFEADLGALPPDLDTNEINFNLLVIQGKCLCKKIAYNDLNGENIRLLKIDLAVDTLSISQSSESNSKYLSFTVPFEKSKFEYQVEDIKPFLDTIQLNRFNIKEVEIKAYSSIEGNAMVNQKLQEKRAQSILKAISEYQLQEVKTKIETVENWDGFMASIQGSPYEAVFKGLGREEIRDKVNADTLGYNLEPYLADQRKAEIKIFVESIYIDSLTPEYLPEKFEKAIRDKDAIRAKAIQTLMYRAVLEGKLDKSELFKTDIPQFKEYVPLANNRLAFYLEFDDARNTDSLISVLRMEVEALLGVEATNGHLNYNRQAIKLYYWAKDPSFLIIDEENKINQVKDFEKDIRKLYNTKIDNYKVNRLMLSFNIIAADYYYEKQDFKNRVRSLKEVLRFVKKAKLSREQTFIMSRYFIYQMQIDWAVSIMLPFIKTGDYDQDFLLTFLSIAVYDEKHVPLEQLYKYTEVAAEKFKEAYCKMYGKPGMSYDYLNDLRLKSVYCQNCN